MCLLLSFSQLLHGHLLGGTKYDRLRLDSLRSGRDFQGGAQAACQCGDRARHGYGHDCRQRRGVAFWVGDFAVSESDAILVARLSAPSAQVLTTIHEIVNGMAVVGGDNIAASGTLEFASGEKEIRVKLLRSARDWLTETLSSWP